MRPERLTLEMSVKARLEQDPDTGSPHHRAQEITDTCPPLRRRASRPFGNSRSRLGLARKVGAIRPRVKRNLTLAVSAEGLANPDAPRHVTLNKA